MTSVEAIEKEIKREEEELKRAKAEADDLKDKTMDAEGNPDLLAVQDLRVALGTINRITAEIDGKNLALTAVKDKPNDPVGAIKAECEAEQKKIDELEAKDKAIVDKIRRQQQEHPGEPIPAEMQDESKNVRDEITKESDRLHGKKIALGLVRSVLKGG